MKKKYTYEMARRMWEDRNYYTLREIAKRHNIGSGGQVASILIKFGFPGGKGRRKQRYSLSESEKGYIAGIIDGEGYIDIVRGRIAVTNTDINLMRWLCSKLGGSLYSKAKLKVHHKAAFGWTLSVISSYSLLPSLYDSLIIKQAVARKFVAKFCVEPSTAWKEEQDERQNSES